MATTATPPNRDPGKLTLAGNIITQQSPFLRLAAELRNRIYEEAFDTTIIITSGKDQRMSASRMSTSRMANARPVGFNNGIILACQQTHSEAIGLYYSTHTFRFQYYPLRGLIDWIEAIGFERINLVKHVELDCATMFNISASYAAVYPDHLANVAKIAETAFRRIRDQVYLPQGLLIAARILSPLGSDAQGKYLIVSTTTPKETLEEQMKILEARELHFDTLYACY